MVDIEQLLEYQNNLQRHLTPAEQSFKWMLEQRFVPFVPQFLIGFYIVDFCLPDRMMIVELDGTVHETTKEYDKRRDEWLRKLGFTIIRIKNNDLRAFDFAKITDRPRCEVCDFTRAMNEAHVQYLNAVVRTRSARPHVHQLPRRTKWKNDRRLQKWQPKYRWTQRDETLGNLERMFRKGQITEVEYNSKLKKYQ